MHLAGIEATRITAQRSTRRLLQSAALLALTASGLSLLTGCGSTYRPVVAAINPVGPSAQPTKYAVAISNPSPTSPGLVTFVDFSGDTVLITANLGVSPSYLVLDQPSTAGASNTGYTINGDGTLNSFPISTSLLTSDILQTTLLASTTPAVSIFPQGTTTYVTEPGRGTGAIGEYQSTSTSGGSTGTGAGTGTGTGAGTGSGTGTTTGPTTGTGTPLALKQELNVPNPIYVVGIPAAARVYALSQGGSPASPGSAYAIDTVTNTPTAVIPLQNNPVYGIMTGDGKRAFVMNKGSNSVSVINAQTNQLDTFSPTPTTPGGPVPAPSSTIPVGANPIWADFSTPLAEMVVANAGDGTTPGSLSIISIPLCNAASQTTNPGCDPNNPVDATGFGSVLAQPAVGVNPVMVAALQDGTRAYVANAGNSNTAGSVSVIDLTTNRLTTTIPLSCHPNYIAATTGVPTGKVYVVCPDSKNMTIIRTDIDTIDTTIPLQGNGVAVRVTAP